VAAGAAATLLLAGCSGGNDNAPPSPTSTSAAATSPAPSSSRTRPPISPRTTVTLPPGSSLPGTLSSPATLPSIPSPSGSST